MGSTAPGGYGEVRVGRAGGKADRGHSGWTVNNQKGTGGVCGTLAWCVT